METVLFTTKEKAFISLSASVAAGCQPCTEYHTNGARQAALCERSIALAVQTAVAVRDRATRTMDEWAAACQGTRPAVDAEFADQKRLVSELAGVAAAVAVNSVPDFGTRRKTALEAGATPEQIGAAIAIARAIKRTAEQKLADAIGSSVESGESCCGSTLETARTGRPDTSGCGCR